jgi:hypothetical protein
MINNELAFNTVLLGGGVGVSDAPVKLGISNWNALFSIDLL